MLFSELKCKEVINLKDCKCLGKICNLEFDECTGQICRVMIPGSNKLHALISGEPEYIICYKDIKKIGPDIIVVDVCCH